MTPHTDSAVTSKLGPAVSLKTGPAVMSWTDCVVTLKAGSVVTSKLASPTMMKSPFVSLVEQALLHLRLGYYYQDPLRHAALRV
jgi:hypothetical protein